MRVLSSVSLITGMLCMVFSLSGCAQTSIKDGTYKGYETPAFTVIESHSVAENKAIEIREYPPHLVAEVQVDGERDKAINQGFRILASYIFGENVAQEKVAMTLPVLQAPQEKIAMTSPVNTVPSADSNRWTVQFSMPKQYTLATLPKPKNLDIRIFMTPKKRVAALNFSGRWTDSNQREHRQKLEAFVRERQLTTVGGYNYLFYDDPFTLPWNRRNEVAIEISEGGSQKPEIGSQK